MHLHKCTSHKDGITSYPIVQTYQNPAKAHIALQNLQIRITNPRSQYFHQCILFIWNCGERMVGDECAIVEWIGG